MSDIKITGKKYIKTINKEFQTKFPYLMLSFMTPVEWEKSRNQEGKSKALSGKTKLSDVRTVTPKSSSEISIHGSTKIKNLENNFFKIYGLHAQVCYADKNGKFYYTGEKSDEFTLSQLNKQMEERGMQKNPRVDSYK